VGGGVDSYKLNLFADASLIIFDCDGVLVDSEHLSCAVVRDHLLNIGLDMSLEEVQKEFLGLSDDVCTEKIVRMLKRPLPSDFTMKIGESIIDALRNEVEAVPGVKEFVASLSLPKCVASNGSYQKMQITLPRCGLDTFFPNAVFSAYDVARPKPSPDLFLHAASCMGVERSSKVVVIEDSPPGIRAAYAAGFTPLGFCRSISASALFEAGAFLVFDSFDKLMAASFGE
jgi:HAD superfamily hydrolase (TIGR01509 family)